MKKAIAFALTVFVCLSLFSACTVTRKITKTLVCGASTMDVFYREDDLPQEIQNTQTVEIEMVKNEKEGGSVFLRNDIADIENVVVSCSDLVCGENVIPASDIEGFRIHYSVFNGEKAYPLAMLPLTDFTNNYTVKKGNNQEYRFNVKTTADTVAGEYTGKITVKYDGGEQEIPMNVLVCDVTLPNTLTPTVYINMWNWAILMYYGDRTQAERDEILRKCFDLSVDYRASVNNCPYITWEGGIEGRVAQLKELFADGRVSTFRVDYDPANVEANRPLYDELVKQGIIDKVIYCMPIDEPWINDEVQYPVIEMYKTFHENFPLAKTFITLTPNQAYRPLYGDTVTNWCTPLWNVPQNIIYDTLETSGYWPYLEVQHRSDFWRYIENDVTGIENWEFGICLDYDDSGYHIRTSDNLWNNSGSFFLIPGRVGDGYVNEDIPVPTTFIDFIRDGMEDFELVEMYKNKAQEFYSDLGITDYSFNEMKQSIYSSLHLHKDDNTDYNDQLKTLLPELRQQLISGIDNLTVIHNESSDLDARTVEVFTAKDATVKIGGEDASQKIDADSYTKHIFNMCAGDTDNYFSVDVTKAGVTTTSSKLIRKSGISSQITLLDIDDNFDQIKTEILEQKRTTISTENINLVTVNGKKAMAVTFNSENDVLIIPDSAFETTDWSGGSEIFFRTLNGSAKDNFTQNFEVKLFSESSSDIFDFSPKTYFFGTNDVSYTLEHIASALKEMNRIQIMPCEHSDKPQTIYFTDFNILY